MAILPIWHLTIAPHLWTFKCFFLAVFIADNTRIKTMWNEPFCTMSTFTFGTLKVHYATFLQAAKKPRVLYERNSSLQEVTWLLDVL